MQQRFFEELESLGGRGRRILVAISGGLDSVVLVDLLIKSGQYIGLAHANFQLRGAESDRDQAFVKQLGMSLQVPVFTKQFDTNNYATIHGMSIQMAARHLRYAWFRELRDIEKYDLIATAHHLNDSLETTLLNLTRGTGLAGLTGIPQKNDHVIRPLLIFRRDEIEEYAKKNNVSWTEDSSNASHDYRRNFVRHKIIPGLKEINPSLEETYARTVTRLQASEELMNMGLDSLRHKYVSITADSTRILKQLTADVQHPAPVLLELIKEYGFNLFQCEAIVEAGRGQPGKVFLSHGFELLIDRDAFVIYLHPEVLNEVVIAENQTDADLGPWHLKIEVADSIEFLENPLTAWLDKRKLTFPLSWRRWKDGDSFHPLGMDHRKKISDFLIDKKVSGAEKNIVTVLESAGEVAWVVGYRIDDRFRITDETKSVVLFRVNGFNV